MNYTRNVEMIRNEGFRIVRSGFPAQVRKELMQGVKQGHLGRLKKQELLPEVFYHPDHVDAAQDAQIKQAEYAISCIARIIAP